MNLTLYGFFFILFFLSFFLSFFLLLSFSLPPPPSPSPPPPSPQGAPNPTLFVSGEHLRNRLGGHGKPWHIAHLFGRPICLKVKDRYDEVRIDWTCGSGVQVSQVSC